MRQKFYTFLFSLFVSSLSFSQGTLWSELKIDDDVTANFPKRYEAVDSPSQKGLRAVLENKMYLITATKKEFDFNASSPELLASAYSDLTDNYLASLKSKGYTWNEQDNIFVDKMEGRMIRATRVDEKFNRETWIDHYFLVNDKLYEFIVIYRNDISKADKTELADWKESITFNKREVKKKKIISKSAEDKAEIGYLIGYFLGGYVFLVFVLLIIAVVLILVFKKKK